MHGTLHGGANSSWRERNHTTRYAIITASVFSHEDERFSTALEWKGRVRKGRSCLSW